MLRFMSSFLKSSGEFRGDPRGEFLGEAIGDPPAEDGLDLGRRWMTGSRAVSLSAACSSSELSKLRSLMVSRWWQLVGFLQPDLKPDTAAQLSRHFQSPGQVFMSSS